jgi:hypothetical protein
MDMEMDMEIETIILEPSRNMIIFSEVKQIDYNICSTELKHILEYIKSILEDINYIALKTDKFEVRGNKFNWSVRISTKSNELISCILKYILADEKCIYLEINNNIYKHTKYKDILELQYHPLSFRQPDNNIRNYLIKFFQHHIITHTNINTLICIGGECTLFGKILSHIKTQYFITDYQSIYDDLKFNYPNCQNISFIDYKKCSLEWIYSITTINNNIDNKICIIANTGYQGLEKHLSTELTNSNADIIYIISCNKKSFQNDYLIMNIKYKIENQIEIKTNYSIWINKLIKIS